MMKVLTTLLLLILASALGAATDQDESTTPSSSERPIIKKVSNTLRTSCIQQSSGIGGLSRVVRTRAQTLYDNKSDCGDAVRMMYDVRVAPTCDTCTSLFPSCSAR